jgi:superfamily II RNA helicase
MMMVSNLWNLLLSNGTASFRKLILVFINPWMIPFIAIVRFPSFTSSLLVVEKHSRLSRPCCSPTTTIVTRQQHHHHWVQQRQQGTKGKTRLFVRRILAAQSNNYNDGNGKEEMSLEEATKTFQPYFNFPLDAWQIEAGRHIVNGRSIVVCAPTGAGKTVVGEIALRHCLQNGYQGIYTTPLKALSNQKFLELRKLFGPNSVGLSTGDMSINIHDASITVMTTEVYRNMAWKEDQQQNNNYYYYKNNYTTTATDHHHPNNSTTTIIPSSSNSRLDNVAVVVLDEFHYMGLRGRGGVWEESVITSQPHTQIVALSATLPNANRLAQWIESVTSRKTELVVAQGKRPVPLRYYFATSDGLYPLFRDPDAGPGAPKGFLGLRGDNTNQQQEEEGSNLGEEEPKKGTAIKHQKNGGGFASDPIGNKRESKKNKNYNNSYITPTQTSFPRGLQLHPDLLRRTKQVWDKVDRLIAKEERKYQEEVSSSRRNNRRREELEGWEGNKTLRLSPKEEKRKREQIFKREMSRAVPRLPFLLKRLEQKNMLPSIFFIFSRAGCDSAAQEVGNFMLSSNINSSFQQQKRSSTKKPKKKGNNNIQIKDEQYNFYDDSSTIDEMDEPLLSHTNLIDKNGRIFRDVGALSDEQMTEFITMGNNALEESTTIYDDIDDDVSFLMQNPFSDENIIHFSSRGLLSLKAVREVASRIQAFNQENSEIAFPNDVAVQFMLGVSSHHAGQLAAHKAFVESLFQSQLMKAVFATETLAAGINMPARTTVICSMSKRSDDSSMNLLETSTLLQMAGRAGRRGMDSDGTCVIVATPFEGPEDAASILLSEVKPITSQFSPSYTLAVNLISRGSGKLDVARDLVQRSFAMWEKQQQAQQQSTFGSIVSNSNMENDPSIAKEDIQKILAAQQHFMSSLNWVVLDAIEQQKEIAHVSTTKLEECLSILATAKSLRKAAYSYEAMVRLLTLQRSTFDYLQEEAKELNTYLTDIERAILEVESDLANFAEEDTTYISDHIKAQEALILKHERDLANHPFTALATIANDALQKGDHTSAMLRNLLLDARGTETASNSSSFEVKSITADEVVKFSKAAKQIERKQKVVEPPSPGDIFSTVAKSEESSDDAFTDILLLISVLESYGCLISLENHDDPEENHRKKYEITSAGKDISLLNFDNSLWALVALGGAWDVKYDSVGLDDLQSSLDLSFYDESSDPSEKSRPADSKTSAMVGKDLPQEEARELVSNLCCLSASEMAGYVSCLVSEGNSRDVSLTDSSFSSFESLSCPQQNVVRCSILAAERLLEVQRKNGLDDLEFPCRLDLSVCSVVTAWTAGCTWNEALEMSKMAPGDLARVLHRAMDALRQFGSLPYHPARSWDAPTISTLSSFGIHPNVRKLCREAATVMNRYPLKDPLPMEEESIDTTEVVYEFDLSAGEDELESPTQSFSMFKTK